MGNKNSQTVNSSLPLGNYEKSIIDICINKIWLSRSRLSHYLKLTKTLILESDVSIIHEYSSQHYFEKNLLILIKNSFKLNNDDEARKQVDILYQINIFDSLMSLYDFLDSTKPYLCYAIKQLNDCKSSDSIIGKLSETCDRASRCASAKKQAFSVLLLYCFEILEKEKDQHGDINSYSKDLTSLEGAKEHINVCFEEFLDQYKERAFNTCFIQPARYYYDCIGDFDGRDHVNIHGINWYLYLLEFSMNIQLPLLPFVEDDCNLGLCSFWSGLNENVWEIFKAPENFGRNFEGIKALRDTNIRNSVVKINRIHELLREAKTPKHLEEIFLRKRNEIAIYIERYAYFFSKEIFIKRVFECLYSESHFQTACDTIYRDYCETKTTNNNNDIKEELPESLVDYLYEDENYILNIEKTHEILSYVGLLNKPNDTNIIIINKVELPININEKNNNELENNYICKVCGSLYQNENIQHCPVCNSTEIVSEEEFINIEISNEFFVAWSSARDDTNADSLAGIYGIWQIIEIQCNMNQALIISISKKIVNDNRFKDHLKDGVMNNSTWLRDSAGIIFRLFNLIHDNNVNFSEDLEILLNKSIEIILHPFELEKPTYLSGHYYGGIYMQILTPLLDAKSNGFNVTNLSLLSQRIAKAVLHCYTTYSITNNKLFHEIKERMYQEYIESTQILIWENRENDIIWNQFYKN